MANWPCDGSVCLRLRLRQTEVRSCWRRSLRKDRAGTLAGWPGCRRGHMASWPCGGPVTSVLGQACPRTSSSHRFRPMGENRGLPLVGCLDVPMGHPEASRRRVQWTGTLARPPAHLGPAHGGAPWREGPLRQCRGTAGRGVTMSSVPAGTLQGCTRGCTVFPPWAGTQRWPHGQLAMWPAPLS